MKNLLCVLALLTALLLAPRRSLNAAEAGRLPAKPNVIFIIADDLGWADVAFHQGNVPTPHLDRLKAGEDVDTRRFFEDLPMFFRSIAEGGGPQDHHVGPHADIGYPQRGVGESRHLWREAWYPAAAPEHGKVHASQDALFAGAAVSAAVIADPQIRQKSRLVE